MFLSPHAFRAAAEEIPHLFIGRLRKVFVELTYPIEWFWCDSADNLVCFVLHFGVLAYPRGKVQFRSHRF